MKVVDSRVTARAVMVGFGVAALSYMVAEALYYRDELLTFLTRVGTALVVLIVGAYALKVIEERRRAKRAPTSATAARGGADVNRAWFLAPSLVMSALSLASWWTSPGLAGFLLLLILPAAVIVLLFRGLRVTGLVSSSRISLAMGNVLSVVSAIASLTRLEQLENPPTWLALASPLDTCLAVAVVVATGCAGFLVPGMIAAAAFGKFRVRS